MKVGSFWAATAFSHCYAALSETPDDDALELTEVIGLGQRIRRPQRRVSGPGVVYLLLNETGFSKLYKHNISKRPLPSDPSGSKPAEEQESEAAPAEKTPRLDTLALKVVSDPLGDPASAGPKKTSKPRKAGHEEEETGLRNRQVEVIRKRLMQILPQLPFEKLSTSLVLTKLEECMQKRKGRFDAFRADVERIIIAYVTEHAEAAKAAATPSANSASKPSVKPELDEDDRAPTLPVAEVQFAPPKMSEQESTTQKRLGDAGAGQPQKSRRVDSSAVERFIRASRLRRSEGPRQVLPLVSADEPLAERQERAESSHLAQPVGEASFQAPVEDESPVAALQVELSDEEGAGHAGEETDGLEVDSWGFQTAMSQFDDSVEGDPHRSEAVLKMLLVSSPTADLLTEGSWEATLSAHARMGPTGRTRRLAQTLCQRWKLLQQPLLEKQKLFKQAYAALLQLQQMQPDMDAADLQGVNEPAQNLQEVNCVDA